MFQRIAALDLGTNTFHLLIADVFQSGIIKVKHTEQLHVKLGEGGITEGRITETAFQRGLTALIHFRKIIDLNEVKVIRAVGTAALRVARNGQAFLDSVKAETGISIKIIEGNKEASLIYMGVKQAVNISKPALIMDIGGGSVEFIFANNKGIEWKKSYPIGAAKLMALFHHSDPISLTDINAIHTYLAESLVELKAKAAELKASLLIGSAGAFETFAALCQIKSDKAQSHIEKSFKFDKSILLSSIEEILISTHIERVNNKAIIPVRTDMIVVASVLTKYIIEVLQIEDVELSTYALKEGLLFESP